MFQIQINGMVEMKMSCVEFFSKTDRHPGTFIPDLRVEGSDDGGSSWYAKLQDHLRVSFSKKVM